MVVKDFNGQGDNIEEDQNRDPAGRAGIDARTASELPAFADITQSPTLAYTVKYAEVPFQLFGAGPVHAGKVGEFFNHSYAVIDLHGPSGAAAVEYYQIPSWGGRTPVLLPPDQKSLLATETLDAASGGHEGDEDRRG